MLRQIILTLTSLILLTSCLSDNGHDGPVDMICWDIATFNGNINDKAQFTIRQVNDLPEATLIAQTAIKTGDKDMTGNTNPTPPDQSLFTVPRQSTSLRQR